MNRHSVLIVNKMHKSIVPLLERLGLIVNYQPNISREETLDIIKDYFGIVVRSKLDLDSEFFTNAPSLKFIARAGAGLDQIDLREVQKRNIEVFNAPEGNKDALAEHSIGLMLSLLHKIVKSNNEIRRGKWLREDNRGFELNTKTVGVIGFGHMGRAFAEKLIGFGCSVITYDIKPSLDLPSHVKKVSWEEFTQKCDIVSLHVPLSERNVYLVNDSWINDFRKNIWLINTSRGKVVKLVDLIKNLDSGKVKGAALDVLENEKFDSLSDSEKAILQDLVNRNNTILTPHVGGWSSESYSRINEVLASKIENFLLQNG
ncbi:phosphoglycerate dehydrogenase [Hyphobacterium sp. CCMP332]|nr:phosphoglycerate dehydrogenase [Hyphobacterium sp. CCMP332]